jgi:four helix bundle protein
MNSSKPRNHQELKVWQVGMDLAEACYRLSARLPKEDRYGLMSQMRRAAISVPANIAEGAARESTADFARFVSIARGSLSELETHIILAERLGLFGHRDDVHMMIRGLRQMLSALRRALLKAKAPLLPL